ncbi:hypothetical protein IHV10_22310 [Fictibacillus sp. 5RED26]|uniref:hypothetical protein n=1 Tax=Fictibacillus sp. 5RED26 TaxID=2745876 RepID=UPI0018CDED90|nr:hypothetical protein [Fictibacillus sp. 5RED26]MBH0159107.1 hypothetical protein [Fictibacillus sp. 5RED26]
MILIKLGIVTSGIAPVIVECNEPETIPREDLLNWIEIEEIPEPVLQAGKTPNLYYNLETGQLFYEYSDRQLSPEERIQQLEAELTVSKEDNVSNMLAITELYELILGGTA